MIIRITDGSTTQTLAAGAARVLGQPVGPSGLRIAAPTTIEPRPRFRAGAMKYSDRGNVQAQVSFSVFYEFASIAATEFFIQTLRLSILRAGTLQLVSDVGSINAYSDCVISDPGINQITGVTVRVDYQIACGPETYTPPDFAITAPSGGWRRTFNPNSGNYAQAFSVLATVLQDYVDAAVTPPTYTITEPTGGWLRTFDPDDTSSRKLFAVVATIANEWTGTAEVYTIASQPLSYDFDPNTDDLQDACNVLATFLTDLKVNEVIG